MKLRFKEDPKEWRKNALLTAFALAVISSVLRWRHVLHSASWISLLIVFGVVALAAAVQPRWFRGYYQGSTRVSFYLSQFLGRIVLVLFFFLILTPIGLILRATGKDGLRLKRQPDAKTYWSDAKETGPLDRMF